MNLKNGLLLAIACVLAALIWLRWWTRPERQVPRAQARLLAALEKQHFDDVSQMLSDDYRDRWEQDKRIVVGRLKDVFGQFAMLTIEREPVELQGAGDEWVLSEKIRLTGIGGPLAMAARDEVNKLREPFSMTWVKRGGKPWDWQLKSADQSRLEVPQ